MKCWDYCICLFHFRRRSTRTRRQPDWYQAGGGAPADRAGERSGARSRSRSRGRRGGGGGGAGGRGGGGGRGRGRVGGVAPVAMPPIVPIPPTHHIGPTQYLKVVVTEPPTAVQRTKA